MTDLISKLADNILALINAQPRSPTKAEIENLLRNTIDRAFLEDALSRVKAAGRAKIDAALANRDDPDIEEQRKIAKRWAEMFNADFERASFEIMNSGAPGTENDRVNGGLSSLWGAQDAENPHPARLTTEELLRPTQIDFGGGAVFGIEYNADGTLGKLVGDDRYREHSEATQEARETYSWQPLSAQELDAIAKRTFVDRVTTKDGRTLNVKVTEGLANALGIPPTPHSDGEYLADDGSAPYAPPHPNNVWQNALRKAEAVFDGASSCTWGDRGFHFWTEYAGDPNILECDCGARVKRPTADPC